jgi:hypothetical protein
MQSVGRRIFALAFLPLAFAGCQDLERQARREFSLANGLVAKTPSTAAVTRQPQAAPRPRDRAPAIIRGIYVDAYAIGSPVRRRELLALADSTEINAFVVDVKDEDGVRYRSGLPMAMEATHPKSIPIHDLKGIADSLTAHGIYPIARIVVFKDPRLSRARPAWSIHAPDGRPWRDRQGLTWVSPWNHDVWEMNIAIAEEAVRAGFREIQFDYVRFPEAYSNLPTQVHPAADSGGTRADAISGFLAAARARIHPLGATITADVFGLSMNESKDVGIGQQWERIAAEVDGVLPMVYPSHYFPTHLPGITRPNRMPYQTIQHSVGMGVIRNERMAAAGMEPARIVPWLQAFTATWNDRGYPYRAEQARAQIQALYDLGVEDWIFWHPSSNYAQIAGAFARETAPESKRVPMPTSLAAQVDRMDAEGAAAVRTAMAAKASPVAAAP